MQVTTRALFIAIFTVAAARAQTPPMASGPRAQRLLSGTHSGQETGVGCADLDGEVAKALIDLGEQARSESQERATTAFRRPREPLGAPDRSPSPEPRSMASATS